MTFLCQTCGKNFGSKAKLNTHKQIHSEKVLICKICDKTLIGIKSFPFITTYWEQEMMHVTVLRRILKVKC